MIKKTFLTFFDYSIPLFGQNKVPNVRLKMLDGTSARLHDFLKDGPMLLDFWATWCEPCKKQMYHLNKFHEHFKDIGLKVLTINTDTPKVWARLNHMLDQRNSNFL